ncbi:Protein translation factor sui1 [Saitozyma sp. JCM 24511]|uniref:Eukaryotic translation initiation factor eIF-1 n=1 Tax=Saitozyma podzolica TaxID=1890683 RepID=A0A427YRT1_9TREE|nr:Eukaryotic translation initiation factor eIF-1 [Saitozyma podzolica]GFZ45866.1 Protein translation factor sui1 [Saitozyma sp. JCM 24511]
MSTTTITKDKVDATAKKNKAPASSAGVANLGPKFDPFDQSDPFGPSSGAGTPAVEAAVGKGTDKIHIRLQQRNGRKTLTTVQGLPEKYDPKKLLKAMKKEFACNGTVVSSADSEDEDSPGPAKPDFGKVLQLQGDQRVAVKNFLVSFGLVTEKEAKDSIVIHGY